MDIFGSLEAEICRFEDLFVQKLKKLEKLKNRKNNSSLIYFHSWNIEKTSNRHIGNQIKGLDASYTIWT